MVNQIITFVLLAVLIVSTSGLFRYKQDVSSADDAFNSYLLNASENYTLWLTENSLDPSPPIVEALTLKSLSNAFVVLNCELTNQQISGHSSNKTQFFEAESNINVHYVPLTRMQVQPYQFKGNFNCTGKINSPFEEVYYFQGEGTYQLTSSQVEEVVVYRNLGITDDYKLNYTVAYTDVIMTANFIGKYLSGTWNDTRMNATVHIAIANELTSMYTRFLLFETKSSLHPATPLLANFLRKLTQNLDLTTIIDEEDLPIPFKPTPTPPTTTPTTTTAMPTTELNTSESTEPATTDGNNVATTASFSNILFVAVIILTHKVL